MASGRPRLDPSRPEHDAGSGADSRSWRTTMSASVADPQADTRPVPSSVDVVVVGAGFSGMYLLHKLRSLGLSTVVFEAGTDVGGTWYWNRYPGARVDVESLAYSYSFDPDLEQRFEWQERLPTQTQNLAPPPHAAHPFDPRKDTPFPTPTP